MKRIYIVAALLASSVVFAQTNYPRDITVEWVHPTLNTDGTSIQPGDLAATRIVCDRHDGTNVIDEPVPIGDFQPGEQQSHVFTGGIPQPGTYTCVGYSITIDNISSDVSNSTSIKYTGKPSPPDNVRSTRPGWAPSQ